MKCPICKKIIPDNTLKCPYCKTRTGLICKHCHAVNSIFDIVCRKCGEEILRLCPECGTVNLPNARHCRNCGFSFVEKPKKVKAVTPETSSPLEYPAKFVSQKIAKSMLERGILSGKKIFSLSGARGIGKSVVVSQIMADLQNDGFFWFYGKCTPITQLTCGGLIQDILFNIFNLPNFCINSIKFKKDATRFFQNEFPYLSMNEVYDFLNFLYPARFGTFEDLLKNKEKTFKLLNKIFDNIIQNNKFIFVIDNFDNIDGFSYEFLNTYIRKDNVWNSLKILLIYNEIKPVKGYFNTKEPEKTTYLDVSLAPFTPEQMIEYIKMRETSDENFPKLNDTERRAMLINAKGIPAYLEQALCYKSDCSKNNKEFFLPDKYDGLISARLDILRHINKVAYVTLIASAVLGDKINLNLIKQIFEFTDNQFEEIVAYLEKLNFITPLNDIFYRFKDLLLWETIVKTAKSDARFVEINTKICNALANFTLNSNAIFGIMAQNLKHPKLALDIWTRNTRLAAYVGDTNLYAISQKQCLALINELDDSETLKTRYNICERLGKLLADFNPVEAMDYLPDAIDNAHKENDVAKEVELLGYMASCCQKTGNYFGNVECVDTVLGKISQKSDLDIALVKCTKLPSLLTIGNCGEVINMIDNEIMPVFDGYLGKPYTKEDIPLDFLYESWLKTYLVLANALILQGNDRSFEILTIIFDIIERNSVSDENFIAKCKIALAFANTVRGDINSSEKILEESLKLYRQSMDNETIIRWNLVNILNSFAKKHYEGLQEDLFQIVTFANNNNDEFTKNILKSLLGKIFKDNNQTKKALEIYNDQITYFSNEKMAIGALLNWYLIADATLVTSGPAAAQEIAMQALEVAENPKIDNYYFGVLFKMIIAKCAITTGDFELAKMYVETGIQTAKRYNMNDLLSRLFLVYGKYFQELGLNNSPNQTEYLTASAKMYSKATELVKLTRNNIVHIEIEKAKNVLKIFCQKNEIKL